MGVAAGELWLLIALVVVLAITTAGGELLGFWAWAITVSLGAIAFFEQSST